jgi:hypothetical protein
MKRLCGWVLIVFGVATVARAALCLTCQRGMNIMSVGTCVECKQATTSGAFKLCQGCSAKLGQCERCRVALAAAGAGKTGSGEVLNGAQAGTNAVGGVDVKAWQKLFADEEWYKKQKGDEQVFGGTLEGLPADNGMNMMMRASFYKLGARNLYTDAGKVAALDALVGKKVEIRGKAVEMDLEGQKLRELWPATVREAGADAAVPGAPDEAAARRLMLKWIKDNNRDATWKDSNGGALIVAEQIQVRPDPNLPNLWQAYVVFKKGGSFSLPIEKATGRILLPVD